jgi:hypothetical protein
MEYREKLYSVVQSLRHNSWKWSVDVNGRVKSGKVLSREVGIQPAERVIDGAPATKKNDGFRRRADKDM